MRLASIEGASNVIINGQLRLSRVTCHELQNLIACNSRTPQRDVNRSLDLKMTDLRSTITAEGGHEVVCFCLVPARIL